MVGGVIMIASMPETPKYYYGKKDYENARKSLTYIGHSNGIIPLD